MRLCPKCNGEAAHATSPSLRYFAQYVRPEPPDYPGSPDRHPFPDYGEGVGAGAELSIGAGAVESIGAGAVEFIGAGAVESIGAGAGVSIGAGAGVVVVVVVVASAGAGAGVSVVLLLHEASISVEKSANVRGT